MKSWLAWLCGLSISVTQVAPALAVTIQPAVAPSQPRLAGQPRPATHHAPADGAYPAGKGLVYVGLEGEPPSRPSLEYFDPATHRTGTLANLQGTQYRSAEQPYLRFDLYHPAMTVIEDRHLIRDALGNFGFSVWHTPGALSKPLIVLLEGADDSTRDMGFLIPYFVGNGMAVLTFDQRGTGLSSGNWRFIGPAAKASDVIAALRSLAGDRAVDFNRVGVWGPSNGGWVAPIIAQRYPLAFMILKSADSESIADNVLYEVRQDLEHGRRFSPQQVDAALAFERRMIRRLATNSGWQHAGEDLRRAEAEPWFTLTRVPADFPLPPPPPVLAAYRATLIYDPTPVLRRTTVPTLALFGGSDRNVDVAAAERGFREDFVRSGMKDATFRVFPGADHLLEQSSDGYEADATGAARFASGYPEIMIRWLRERRILR
jgi:alpha-beta hydrolase superfamily lysophospholipase